MENNVLPEAHTRLKWKILAWFTIALTVFLLGAIVYLPDVPLDAGDLGTLFIFFFYPIFYFLDGLRFIQLPDYGMGAIGIIVTVPLGIVWVACITALTLFGPGKWRAENDQRYAVIRKGIIFLGTLYLVLCLAMFVSNFLGI